MLEVEAMCTWRECPEGEVIIDRSDSNTNVYFLIKGKVNVMNFLSDSQNVALAELNAGSAFGELSAIDLKVRSARVTAAEPTLVAELDGQYFRDLIIECPRMALAMLKRFSGLIRTLTLRVTTLTAMSPHQRVFHELLRISVPDPAGTGSWVINKTPSHTEMADVAGTDKQSVAEAIGSLVGASILERKHRSLVIRDRGRLERLCEQ